MSTLALIWDELTEAERGALLLLVSKHRGGDEIHMGTLPFVPVGEAYGCIELQGPFGAKIAKKLKPHLPNDYFDAATAVPRAWWTTQEADQIPPKPSEDAVWDGSGWKMP